jgi:hypothetical protein
MSLVVELSAVCIGADARSVWAADESHVLDPVGEAPWESVVAKWEDEDDWDDDDWEDDEGEEDDDDDEDDDQQDW